MAGPDLQWAMSQSTEINCQADSTKEKWTEGPGKVEEFRYKSMALNNRAKDNRAKWFEGGQGLKSRGKWLGQIGYLQQLFSNCKHSLGGSVKSTIFPL